MWRSVEQWFQFSKSRLFMDYETAVAIRRSHSGIKARRGGRNIVNFKAEKWDTIKLDIMLMGINAKFNQNPKLKEFLLSTSPRKIAEAFPSREG